MISEIVRRKAGGYRSKFTLTCRCRQALSASLIFYLSISLVACATDNSSAQVSGRSVTRARPTPTRLAPGTLLYQADWSHGLAGWRGSAAWKATHGLLQSDLSDANVITSPFRWFEKKCRRQLADRCPLQRPQSPEKR